MFSPESASYKPSESIEAQYTAAEAID
jgi:hypothetical protein